VISPGTRARGLRVVYATGENGPYRGRLLRWNKQSAIVDFDGAPIIAASDNRFVSPLYLVPLKDLTWEGEDNGKNSAA